MKKIILFAALLATISSGVRAQTFTEVNSDGVAIQYSVTEGNNVKVIQNAYAGRLVVPAQVLHEGVTYTVNELANGALNGGASPLYYVELPATLEKFGSSQFQNIGLDTLRFHCVNPPTNAFGVPYEDDLVRQLFGNNRLKNTVVIVPDGRMYLYRGYGWGLFDHLQSPSSVLLTMFAPKNVHLVVGYRSMHLPNAAPAYVSIYAEIGERLWLAPYHQNHDTVFVGWDNGGIYLTEVTGADTIYPIYQPVNYSTLNTNNVSTLVKFTGQMSYYNGVANYFVPGNGNISPFYSNGLWVAGTDAADLYLRSSVQRFSTGDYAPGPVSIDGTHSNDLQTRMDFNRVWSVTRADIDDFIAHVGTPGYEIPENILTWPGNGGEGYAPQLAPYYDADGDGVYSPTHGDYPLIKGDQMLFGIFNDNCVHSETGSAPMGIEVHMSAYSFNEPNDVALNNTVFVSYKVINRSLVQYNDAHFGAFSDFDLGYAYDDYIGCDVKNGMAYAYNGMSNDMYYGTYLPAQGTIILGGAYALSDNLDNPLIDIDKMRQFFPSQLATYQLPDGSYDTLRLTADADLFYPDAWYFTPGAPGWVNASINGMNYGNNIADDERLGMTNFTYYENSTNSINGEPQGDYDYYYYMSSYWKNSMHIKYGGNGISTGTTDLSCNFMFPNDSDPLHWGTAGAVPDLNPNDWNEINAGNTPGDRRGVQGSGPFCMNPGSENTLDLAFVTAFGNDGPWSSVEQLRQYAPIVRRQFVRDTTDSGRPFTYRPYSAPIIGISDVATTQQVKVYPNPARDMVTVSMGTTVADVAIYDIRGNKVLSRSNAQGVITFNLSSLPKGIYILHCGSTVSRLVKL